MNYKFTNNWREKVASMTEPDDVDIEKTFADIASGFVANKVGDLMKDQYRIGFEVVKKNEDNTRMLGVFAFKVDKQLLFAPVFFLSGEIKGPLLYRCDSKQFVPANKDWASYLISSIQTKDGRGINRTQISETAPMVAMDKIMMRPKEASAGEVDQELLQQAIDIVKNSPESANMQDDEFDAEVNATYDALMNQRIESQMEEPVNIKEAFTREFGENVEEGLILSIAKSATFKPGILKEFLQEKGYGKIAVESIVKAASEEGSEKLLEHIINLYDSADNFIPDNICDFDKKASTDETIGKLEVHFDLTKEAAEYPKQYYKDGFFMFDRRYKEKCNKVIKQSLTESITSVTDAGTYDVLKENGELLKDCFCALILPSYNCCCAAADRKLLSEVTYRDKVTPQVAVIKDGKIAIQDKVVGITHSTTSTDMESLPGEDAPSVGGVYTAYTKYSSTMSAPFYVKSIKEVDGVKYCKVKFINNNAWCNSDDDKLTSTLYCYEGDEVKILVINKDARKSDHNTGVYGDTAKFIKLNSEVSTKKDGSCEKITIKLTPIKDLATKDCTRQWLFDQFDAPSVSITFDKEASHKFAIHDLITGESTYNLSKFQVMTKVARDMQIHADDAYDVVNTAQETGSCEFIMDLTKEASRIHIVGSPRFTEEFDSITGIPVVHQQRFVLDTAAEQQFDERPHVGDAMNPTTATGLPNTTVVTVPPEQLRDLADSYNLPNVFEHGVVGTLADTFDAGSLLEKYIPRLLEAVDSLGRIKFLLYWKPDDFQKSYGADDMNNLEAQIDQSFNSISDVTLQLVKKSDKKHMSDEKVDNKLD